MHADRTRLNALILLYNVDDVRILLNVCMQVTGCSLKPCFYPYLPL